MEPLAFVRANRERFLTELQEFIRFPSVSVDPDRAADVKNCASWLAAHLKRVGFNDVRVTATDRHPIVTASAARAPGRPTVLVYGHYDVQPADPVRAWTTPPFQPAIEGDRLRGRGACDDKGQLFTHVKALEAFLQTRRPPPVNVTCLFEGEEEIDSPHLRPFVQRHREMLKANCAVMSDTPMLGVGRPAISYAERGQLRMEIEVRGPSNDLHSGNFGGAVHNPLQALCELIGRLHDAQGRVAIPGFYDRVRQLGQAERQYLAKTGPRDGQILENAGVPRGWGERGYSAYERTTARPALTINGIEGGYTGPGVKAVIPSRATAKISFRLVPNQDPVHIDALVRQHVARLAPPSVKVSVKTVSAANPALMSPGHPAIKTAAFAYQRAFGKAPVMIRSGGSIPVVNTFHELLGIPTVLMGFALPDSNIHAPNETMHLPTFYKGIETSLYFLAAAAKVRSWSSTATATRARAIS